ncbi:short chain dehydrogenase/reductase [Eremomyces bilateralis CBS 781.70]|uniref:Short-chain dehydrogenase/reductase 3 n=1 Tax=Eremomyces bilateralis CBS 781.70 TaxID=1392243 RepID=A0A6G1G779_9PEZI|nr:short chain dehydrogenase/reductase [Eremomyces bilateralis CBS 781.70]KAF1813786.1 short chain dehydrogenase/reductase [Eremomyces bilateralis CBS 781.70]
MNRDAPRRAGKAWYELLSVDLLYYVASYTVLHPFVAWIVPLCLRAQLTPYNHRAFLFSVGYAAFLTCVFIANGISKILAYGKPRKVDLGEEVIVVTGGGGGLGLFIAQVYGIRGASVAVLDVKSTNEDEVPGITFYKCDVRDKNALAKVAEKIEKELGPPTILINNAGIMHGKSLLDLSCEEIEKTIQVNLLSQFYTIKQFLPGMLEQGFGTIVTVASVLGHLGCANLADYCASKAGLIALHTSLAGELEQSPHPSAKNIRTVLCTPGQMATPLFAGVQTPSNFLAPVLEPVDVAKQIMKMVDAGEGGEIALPLYSRTVHFTKCLPAGVQWVVRRLSGMDRAMVDYSKVAKKREKSR